MINIFYSFTSESCYYFPILFYIFSDGDFHLFDSGLFYQDLIFSDEAVRLVPIEPEMQNYKSYLGYDFIGQIRNLDHYMCVPAASSASKLSAALVTLSAVIFSLVLAL